MNPCSYFLEDVDIVVYETVLISMAYYNVRVSIHD